MNKYRILVYLIGDNKDLLPWAVKEHGHWSLIEIRSYVKWSFGELLCKKTKFTSFYSFQSCIRDPGQEIDVAT
jgi:hypothetical protein